MKNFSAEHRDAPVIAVDAGGIFALPEKPGAAVRNRAMLDGLARLNVAVVNLSYDDAPLLAGLGPRPKGKQPVFVSANVGDQSGKLPVAPYVVHVGAKGERIAFVGLSVAPTPQNPQFPVEEAPAALRRLLPELKQKADCLVVLAYMPNYEVISLATTFPEVDAIVVGYELQSAMPPYQIGKVWILTAEYEGKAVGHLGLAFGAGKRLEKPVAAAVRLLDANVADQPELAALVAAAKKKIPAP